MKCKRPGIPDLPDKTLKIVFNEFKKCAEGISEHIYFDDGNRESIFYFDKPRDALYFMPPVSREAFDKFLNLCQKWEQAAEARLKS